MLRRFYIDPKGNASLECVQNSRVSASGKIRLDPLEGPEDFQTYTLESPKDVICETIEMACPQPARTAPASL